MVMRGEERFKNLSYHPSNPPSELGGCVAIWQNSELPRLPLLISLLYDNSNHHPVNPWHSFNEVYSQISQISHMTSPSSWSGQQNIIFNERISTMTGVTSDWLGFVLILFLLLLWSWHNVKWHREFRCDIIRILMWRKCSQFISAWLAQFPYRFPHFILQMNRRQHHACHVRH